jgi:pimeloyl-ACP methyl ester carboxylesterase
MMRMEPFSIAVSDDALAELRLRLQRTRWPNAYPDTVWRDGIADDYLRRLVADWRERFDWRTQERQLNALPQFRAEIDGQGVHFLHVKGKGPKPLPLVLTHGWPSSYIEFLPLIGPLSDPAAHGGDPADAFDVVVPSLPGFGFSDIPARAGMTPRRIAGVWAKLMEGLGYPRFGAHGGDWGAYVTALLGLDAAPHLVGIHMGMLSLSVRDAARGAEPRTKTAWGERVRNWQRLEHGYTEIQGTKPQTLAYGLNDSPTGVAAWIAEKWRSWTDCGGDPESAISRDVLLTNIAIYWFTGTINSANRLYYETRRHPTFLEPGQRIEVPSGFFFETALAERTTPSKPEFLETPRPGAPPRERAERAFNVQRWHAAPRGGHFPALETPDLLCEELRGFFRPLRP